jgi:tetratricopeptide (TPR) repeat protein
MDVAERVLPDNPTVPGSLVRTDGGNYRFIGDTVGPVILGLMSRDRQRHWHAAFLSVLAEKELGRRQRAFHLLGAGKSAEGIRALVDEAREAESRNDYRIAFVNLRDALEHYSSNDILEKDVPGVERTRLALDAARLATLVGELHWAREVLGSSIREGVESPSIHLEHTVLRANVLRELRHASEAAVLYAEARALIARHPSLQDQLVPVQLEEAANDGARGEGQGALRRLETIVKKLEGEGTSPLLGLALHRMGLLCAQLGRTRAGLVYELRCLRIARKLKDHQLAARALVNLGHFYRLLGRPRRALLTFDRAQRELVSCPNDGIAASELVNRAEVLIGLGREDEAYMLLLRARALRERAAERARMVPILILLGHLCQHGGKLAAGAGYYREAIALAEEFELPAARVAQSNLGELHLQMGAWEEAERFLRLGLSDPKPDHRGLTMVNLGRLRREQGRYREALQLLGEAETLLGGVSAHYRTHAVLETARVLFAAGDVEGAWFHLLQVRDDVGKDQGQLVGYRVLEGLIASTRGEAPERAFKSALDVLQESHDPTLVAEALIGLLERALMSSEFDPAWFARQLEVLEEAATRTDARPVAMRGGLIRARFSERCAAASGVEGFAQKLQQRVERSGGAVEAAIGELLKELPGAKGAAVFVVGLDDQGKPMVSAARSTSKTEDKRIRPYRVAVREFDRNLFRRALEAAGGNVHEAARKLRLPVSTFRYRAIKLGLLKPTPRD